MTDTQMSMIDSLAVGVATPAGWIISSLIALWLAVFISKGLSARRARRSAERRICDAPPQAPKTPAPNASRDETHRRRAALSEASVLCPSARRRYAIPADGPAVSPAASSSVASAAIFDR